MSVEVTYTSTKQAWWYAGNTLLHPPPRKTVESSSQEMCRSPRKFAMHHNTSHQVWTKFVWVNTVRKRQNSRRFADDTLKRFFLNENVLILIKLSLKFVPKDPINNIPPLVQTMAYLNRRIYPSLGLNEISYIIGSSGFFLSFCAYFPWFFQ